MPMKFFGRFDALARPVIGRVVEGQLRLDMRCLDGEAQERAFLDQLARAVPLIN